MRDVEFEQSCISSRNRRLIEQEHELSLDDIVPLEDRLAVPISSDATESLLYHLETRWDRPKAVNIGWDLRRTDGDGLGWDSFRIATTLFNQIPDECYRPYDATRDRPWLEKGPSGKYDTPVPRTGETVCDTTPYFDRAWESFDRPQIATDVLLIDVMSDAMPQGWEAPPDIAEAVEHLRHIAEQRRAARDPEYVSDAEFLTIVRKFSGEPDMQPTAAPSDKATVPLPSNSLLRGPEVIADLGAPILEGFLAGQHGRAAPDAPTLPDGVREHPLYDQINSAIGHALALAERSPAEFRASAVVDVLSVLALVHKGTCNAVVARIRGTGAILPEGKVHLAAQRFLVRVEREFRVGAGWRTDHKGQPDALDADNMGVFLRLVGVETRFNVWLQRVELRWQDGEWVPLTDFEANRLRSIASQQEHRYRPAKEYFRDMLTDHARQTSFDPVIDKIDECEAAWDGVPRLDTLLTSTCGSPDDAYHRAVANNLVGGIVKRARHPGVKHDETVILIGPQGFGKSKFCRILALNDMWFSDSVVFDGGSAQNTVPQLFGKLVIELSELDGMARREVQSVKRFLTAQSDNITLKYQVFASDHHRRCVFVGTSNDDKPLADTTGNRRFLPVKIERRIDTDWLRENIVQIVGEAAHYESRGRSFGVPEEVWSVAAQHQDAARTESVIEVLVRDLLENQPPATFVTSADLTRAMTMAKLHPITKGLEPIMGRVGYVYFQGQAPSIGKTRGWVKSEDGTFKACTRLVPSGGTMGGAVKLAPVLVPPPMPPPLPATLLHVTTPSISGKLP